MIFIMIETQKKAGNHKVSGMVFNHQTFYPESLL